MKAICFIVLLPVLLAVLPGCWKSATVEELVEAAYKENVNLRFDEGYRQAKKCLSKDDKNVAALMLGGYAAAQLGNSAEAEEMFVQAVEVKPDDFMTQYFLGWIYYSRGRYADALPPLERAYKLRDKQSPDIRRSLLTLLVACCHKDEIIKQGIDYLTELEKMPVSRSKAEEAKARALYANARAFFLLKATQYQNAGFFFLAAQRLEPANPAYMQNVAVFYDVYQSNQLEAMRWYKMAADASAATGNDDITRRQKALNRIREIERERNVLGKNRSR
jgi:Flp pilus assembly protein TadD